MIKCIRLLSVTLFLFSPAAFAGPPEDAPLGGSVEAVTPDGQTLHFPLLKTDIDANVNGDLATVRVTQEFANPAQAAMNATYLFPLNHDAAVYRMTMETGNEIVEAKIKEIEEAQEIFEKAKKEGKSAALLTQHRPNMFTQRIANLMPGMPVKVTISYVQSVPKADNAYELALPLIVGPRYQPMNAGVAPSPVAKVSSREKFGQWELEQLPAYPKVAGLNIPDTIEKDRVSIRVHLNGGMPVAAVTSSTHAITTQKLSDAEQDITLADTRTLDNRDFMLQYRLSGTIMQSGVLAHRDERGGFFSLMIETPAKPDVKDIAPREMVFVLDTSGSMSGEPVEASKTFMRHALNALRPQDYFRVIRFSNNASEFTSGPVPATQENVQAGMHYVSSLQADGGTEIATAVDQAFGVAQQPGTLRLVVFLTDGYIGNEAEILNSINAQKGDARIYALGVGTSVNRYLLEEMARAGKGFARFIDPTEKSDDVAIQLANKLETPVLTDISIDWGSLQPKQLAPQVIPDLFAGSGIRVQGQYARPGTYQVTVKGLANGRHAQMPVLVALPEQSDATSEAIPLIWARTMIAEKMRILTTPSTMRDNSNSDQVKAEVTKLGLDYALVTRWTSFVAVSRKVANANPDANLDANVPLPMVKGVTEKAYGEANHNPVFAQNFSGGATPEPGTLSGLALVGGAAFAALRRRRKEA